MNRNILISLGIVLLVGVACQKSTPTQPDNQPPTVSMMAPAQNDTISGMYTLKVDASDNNQVDSVQYYVDNTRIATVRNSPFDYQWQSLPYADSTQHSIYARAYDGAQNSTKSDAVTVTIVSAEVSLSQDVQPIFNAYCVSCHGGNGGLVLGQGQAYSNLVNTTSFGYAPLKRVVPAKPDSSVLYLKISSNPPINVGQRMPQGGALPQDEILTIKYWILQGAKDN